MRHNHNYFNFIWVIFLVLVGWGFGVGQSLAGDGLMQIWDQIVVPESAGERVEMRCGEIAAAGQFGEPELVGVSEKREWSHTSRAHYAKQLPNFDGEVIEDRYTAGGLELVRQVWQSKGRDCAAVRVSIINQGSEAIKLLALVPWRGEGSQAIELGGGAETWEFLTQQWQKNGCPQAFAVKGNSKSGAGSQAETPEDQAAAKRDEAQAYDHDQFVLFHRRDGGDRPSLRIGYLDQMGHLGRFRTVFEDAGGVTQLKEFSARCEFDGCEVPPGGSRTTQWVMFSVHDRAGDAMRDYADRVARYYGVEQPGPAPTVWCSWYYWGLQFTQGDLAETLGFLCEHPQPYDVVLIDECWAVRGDWRANSQWSDGMRAASDRIRQAGYMPGLWTCPYVVDPASQLAKEHPEWLLKHMDGSPHFYNRTFFVLDPTYPGVCDHLEEQYRRLTCDDGFPYHKLDFMRAVIQCKEDKPIRFYQPSVTRVEAFRIGLEAIRRGAGPGAYISMCGGHYGASLGLVNSQRSGGDVKSMWSKNWDPLETSRQNLYRTWMGRLWHTDGDAIMIRRQSEKSPTLDDLSLGLLTDAEAKTMVLNQYLAGGMVCLTEKLGSLDADRLALYRHVIPSVNSPGVPIDVYNPLCPSEILTQVKPVCDSLPGWVTAAVINWSDTAAKKSVELTDAIVGTLSGDQYLVSEFFSQKVLGIYKAGEVIDLGEVAAHESRLVRITPWDGRAAVLAGTDLHFSGGGVEIAQWSSASDRAEGRVETAWGYPVTVCAAFPAGDGFELQSVTLNPGQKNFYISRTSPQP